MIETVTRYSRFVLPVFLLAIPVGVRAKDDPKGDAFFEKHVRPVLVANCQDCHGEDLSESGLRVDSLAGLLKGGTRGPALVPGKPKKSLLILAVNHADQQLHMPPKRKLPTKNLLDLAKWIEMGAPWPNAKPVVTTPTPKAKEYVITNEQRNFWAFRPPTKPTLPEVKNRAWIENAIDRFVLAKLEQAGFRPAPRADRRTLIRRVTLDLTGLPPTPDEVRAFLADTSPTAYTRLVERLLASPKYGERWGRHWLDVARYADSNGLDENIAYVNAFRYRDYVIGSFNEGKPFDRFVREQLAGDLLPRDDPTPLSERITATGFLSLGAKMLAEDDPKKMQMDIIDEQIDTTARAFMGLTFGCARCHDHKFDPIPTEDYYSLAGIFESTKTMENFKVVAVWQERPVPRTHSADAEEKAARIARLEKSIAETVAKSSEQVMAEHKKRAKDYLRVASSQLRVLEQVAGLPKKSIPGAIVLEAESFQRGNLTKYTTGYGQGIGVIAGPGGRNHCQYDVTVPKAGLYHVAYRYAAAQSRPTDLLIDGDVALKGTAGQVTGSWYPNTQRWFVEGTIRLNKGKVVLGFERNGPIPHIDKFVLLPVEGENERLDGAGLAPLFVRQWSDYLRKREVQTLDDAGLRQAIDDPKGPFRISDRVEALFAKAVRERLTRQRAELASLNKSKRAMAMAVSDASPKNTRIHIRGSHVTLGREVPRRFPRILAPTRKNIAKGSGRLQLARWLTEPDHPLTARVIVNRVWRWHFGKALVRSPDNFGRLGQRPTHPELLDYLAVWFVEHEWSLKDLHRLIVTSSAYRMSTKYNPNYQERDPENKLLWRWNRRRLEAEAIRDSLLAIGESLDHTMGGSLLPTKPRGYVTSSANVNPAIYVNRRRSVYLPVVRSALYDMFRAFDFADPATLQGDRATTTAAAQALFMMNSELVAKQTAALADRLLSTRDTDEERVATLYEVALSRKPTTRETARALGYIAHYRQLLEERGQADDSRRLALQSLCRAVVSSNEFVFLN